MSHGAPPVRVRVTRARRPAARVGPVRVTRDIDEQTALGEVWMRSLVRTQLRLSVSVVGAVLVVLGGLPLAMAVAPQLRSARVAGVALPWLVLGLLVYPLLLLAGWLYVRAAERTERDFATLAQRDVAATAERPPP